MSYSDGQDSAILAALQTFLPIAPSTPIFFYSDEDNGSLAYTTWTKDPSNKESGLAIVFTGLLDELYRPHLEILNEEPFNAAAISSVQALDVGSVEIVKREVRHFLLLKMYGSAAKMPERFRQPHYSFAANGAGEGGEFGAKFDMGFSIVIQKAFGELLAEGDAYLKVLDPDLMSDRILLAVRRESGWHILLQETIKLYLALLNLKTFTGLPNSPFLQPNRLRNASIVEKAQLSFGWRVDESDSFKKGQTVAVAQAMQPAHSTLPTNDDIWPAAPIPSTSAHEVGHEPESDLDVSELSLEQKQRIEAAKLINEMLAGALSRCVVRQTDEM